MKLKNMQDIGGCRAIVASSKKVVQISRDLKKHPNFKIGGKVKFKDYLSSPKEDGYRGFHIVGTFGEERPKQIEIQIRSILQHDWATALEIVDLFTGQALKSNVGEKDWKEFFIHVSQQIAIMEDVHLFEAMDLKERYEKYRDKLNSNVSGIASAIEVDRYIHKLEVINKLEAFAHSLNFIGEHIEEQKTEGYVLLEIDTENATLASTIFPKDSAFDAESAYIELEKRAAKLSNQVVALVSTTAVGGIKQAYPNYFADSKEFIKILMMIQQVMDKNNGKNKILNWIKNASFS